MKLRVRKHRGTDRQRIRPRLHCRLGGLHRLVGLRNQRRVLLGFALLGLAPGPDNGQVLVEGIVHGQVALGDGVGAAGLGTSFQLADVPSLNRLGEVSMVIGSGEPAGVRRL